MDLVELPKFPVSAGHPAADVDVGEAVGTAVAADFAQPLRAKPAPLLLDAELQEVLSRKR
jgi:hypothetical protein